MGIFMDKTILLSLALGLCGCLWAEEPEPTATPVPTLSAADSLAVSAISNPSFSDHLPPIDHARIWTRFEAGYNYSLQGDLVNSVGPINSQSYVNPAGLGAYTGTVTASHDGLDLGFEMGLLLDTRDGIALGVHYLQNNQTSGQLTYPNGPSNPDTESLTLLPTVIPITLDYYYFLPDEGGRFFLTAGTGLYLANVRVSQTTTSANLFGSNTNTGGDPTDVWSGNLASATVGFQVGIGREFALGPSLGLSLIARGRYARLSNLQGTLLDSGATQGQFGLAANTQGVVDIDPVSNIQAASGEHYATLDFTGFDLGTSLNFYGF